VTPARDSLAPAVTLAAGGAGITAGYVLALWCSLRGGC
jgi:hypothetical protein